MKNKEKAISKDVAMLDLVKFVNNFSKKEIASDKIEEMYPAILDAIMDGKVVFNESMVPTYTLMYPIKNTEGAITLSEINFKTRIKPVALASILKGLELKTDALTAQLRMTANITGQLESMADTYDEYDWDAISQIASVFS